MFISNNQDIRFVLVGTTHPGNIGASARALKTMGFERLVLVNPKHFPHASATARAAGADDLLAKVKVVSSIKEAIAGCHLVVALSARERAVDWPTLSPRHWIEKLSENEIEGGIAILFGREHSGLTNEELAVAHLQIIIPTIDSYRSLNLAATVQLMSYELATALNIHREVLEETKLEITDAVSADQMEGFYGQLEKTLKVIKFLDVKQPKTMMMQRLRRLFNRAKMDKKEFDILRGILTKVLKDRVNDESIK